MRHNARMNPTSFRGLRVPTGFPAGGQPDTIARLPCKWCAVHAASRAPLDNSFRALTQCETITQSP
jgi:hypothetical protein